MAFYKLGLSSIKKEIKFSQKIKKNRRENKISEKCQKRKKEKQKDILDH
jgi:hypothetical protein